MEVERENFTKMIESNQRRKKEIHKQNKKEREKEKERERERETNTKLQSQVKRQKLVSTSKARLTKIEKRERVRGIKIKEKIPSLFKFIWFFRFFCFNFSLKVI